MAAPNGASKFTGTATAKTPDAILFGCGATDTWTIDEAKALNVKVDCAAK